MRSENREEVSTGHEIIEVLILDALESFAASDVHLKIQQLSEVLRLERMGKT